jgi:hypothetical protein
MNARWLATAGMVVAGGLAALPAQAQAGVRVSGGIVISAGDDRGYRGYRPGDRRGPGPAFRYGYDRGWREGSEEGSRDGRRNRDPRFWREDEFRDGDSGYKRWMGPRGEYSQGFREGYRTGYRRAYAASRPGWRDRDGWARYRYDERYRPRDRRHDGRYDDRYGYGDRYEYGRDARDRYDERDREQLKRDREWQREERERQEEWQREQEKRERERDRDDWRR